MYLYCIHYSNMQTNPKLPPKYDTHNPEYTHTHTQTHTRYPRQRNRRNAHIIHTQRAEFLTVGRRDNIIYNRAFCWSMKTVCKHTHTRARAISCTHKTIISPFGILYTKQTRHARCHARAHIDKYICNVHMYLKRYQRFMCVVSRIARQLGWMNEWILHIMYRAISTDWNAKHSSLACVYTRYNNMYLRWGGAQTSAHAPFLWWGVGLWFGAIVVQKIYKQSRRGIYRNPMENGRKQGLL